MVEIGIITTPRDTINKSIESLRQSYTQVINIYAEPGDYNIKDKGTNLKINKKQLGCFGNYHNALSDLVKTDKEHVLVLSDDFIYTKGLFKKIPFHGNYGYYALFTPINSNVRSYDYIISYYNLSFCVSHITALKETASTNYRVRPYIDIFAYHNVLMYNGCFVYHFHVLAFTKSVCTLSLFLWSS